ncbi:MAG: type I restriction-modification enzyme R subunit C-terminal domain-containing protein [Solirubrobacterales bacterium]
MTQTDIDELERILRNAGVGSPEDLERASQEEGGLGAFLRSLVGLDRDAATDALAAFIEGKTLSANQHEFVAMIVEHLTANGTMDPGLLYEPPLTTLAPGGPEALFADAEVDALITAIRAVDSNARPQDEAA